MRWPAIVVVVVAAASCGREEPPPKPITESAKPRAKRVEIGKLIAAGYEEAPERYTDKFVSVAGTYEPKAGDQQTFVRLTNTGAVTETGEVHCFLWKRHTVEKMEIKSGETVSVQGVVKYAGTRSILDPCEPVP